MTEISRVLTEEERTSNITATGGQLVAMAMSVAEQTARYYGVSEDEIDLHRIAMIAKDSLAALKLVVT